MEPIGAAGQGFDALLRPLGDPLSPSHHHLSRIDRQIPALVRRNFERLRHRLEPREDVRDGRLEANEARGDEADRVLKVRLCADVRKDVA